MTVGFANASQLHEVFLAGGMGFLLGAYYDVFRVIRCLHRSRTVSVFIQDVLYFVTSAPMAFVCLLAITGGVWRWYIGVGWVVGFAAYRYTVGLIIVKAAHALLKKTGSVYHAIKRATGIPLARLKKLQKKRKKFKKSLATNAGTGV